MSVSMAVSVSVSVSASEAASVSVFVSTSPTRYLLQLSHAPTYSTTIQRKGEIQRDIKR